jgi:predicted ATPase
MLTQIKLTNFKCFKNETAFPLSQLNLLTGINGRGKSTLLQSLLLMRQSIEHNGGTGKMVLNGNCVNLGYFDDVRNKNVPKSEAIVFEYLVPNGKGITYSFHENGDDEPFLDVDVVLSNDSSEKRRHNIHQTILEKERDYFGSIHYLSADRVGLQDFYVKATLPTFLNVGVKGELTVNVLYEQKNSLINDKLCLGKGAKTLATQTEAWLGEIFDSAKVEIPDSETKNLELFFNTCASTDRLKAVNVGFGYSYILPIIVSGLIAKAGEILIVENPEAHLHPQAQSRLTQFLAKVSRCGVQVFIESHSEHILNALRLAVLKEIITPEDLNILSFRQKSENTVMQIPINLDGELEDWPKDFFNQEVIDLGEMFKLRRQKKNKR